MGSSEFVETTLEYAGFRYDIRMALLMGQNKKTRF